MLQKTAPESLKVHLCILRLLFRTVPAYAELAQLPFTAQYQNTMQKYYSRKARGQYTDTNTFWSMIYIHTYIYI